MQYVEEVIHKQANAKNILTFEIEYAGYGATLYRLMCALNLCLLKENDAIMDFSIQSGYKVKELFDMKHLENTNKKEKMIKWGDFLSTVYYT